MMQCHLCEIGLEQQLNKLVLLVQALLAGQSYEPVTVQGIACLPFHAVFQSLLGKGFLHITILLAPTLYVTFSLHAR